MKNEAERWLIEKLVSLAQTGDRDSQAAVVDAFAPLIRSTATRYRDVAYEDAIQEGYVSLLECIGSFDASRGVPFAAYAKSHVQGDVRTAMRRLWTVQGRSVTLQDYDGEDGGAGGLAGTGTTDFGELDDGSAWTAVGGGFSGVELRMMIEAAGLSPREADGLRGLLMGLTCSEIAQLQGVSVETVKTWRKRAFRKLRTAWSEE